MRITDVRVTRVFMPFGKPRLWSSGRRPGATRLVIELETSAGITGLGETIALWPFVEPVLRDGVIPLVLGRDPHDIEKVHRLVEGGAGFHHHRRALVAALCGVEMAMWDVVGKAAGVPLHQLWGGLYRDTVPMTGLLSIDEPSRVAAAATELVAQGFRTLKLKAGLDPAQDLAMAQAVRAAVGPAVKLRIDPNGAWTPGTAKRLFKQLEPLDLEFVEQPLPTESLLELAELRRSVSIPIAVDESAYTQAEALNVVRAGAADVIICDPHQSGGLWEWKKVAAIAEAAGMPIAHHSGGELGISQAALLHLAASTPNCLIAHDCEYALFAEDVITERLPIANGAMPVPRGPGLGVELDHDRLRRFATAEIKDPYLDRERPAWFPAKPQY